MENLASVFYDKMTDEYHLNFKDWDKSIKWQSEIIDRIIQKYYKRDRKNISIYDCSCGIGTQAIGMSLLGYSVYATDISENEINRAKKEAKRLKADLSFGIADFRLIDKQIKNNYDVIISCDNSLPHLLEEIEMYKSLENIYLKLNKEGMFLASIRDYDGLIEEKPNAMFPYIYDEDVGKRRIVIQIWDWKENNVYNLSLYMIKQNGEVCDTTCYYTKYRAYKKDEIFKMMGKIGYKKIEWLMPETTGYYQPIIIGFRI